MRSVADPRGLSGSAALLRGWRDPAVRPLVLFGLLNLLLHLATSGVWGFHRDELLYLALGDHLDWGFWSNPPLIGLFGRLADLLPGEGPWTVRLIPALLSTGLVALTGLLAREFGGGRGAVTMACLSTVLSPALLRIGVLFQPVVFDVLCWTCCFYLMVRYLKTGRDAWLWGLGVSVGLGLLNKYSVAFLVLGTLAALPLTPQRRLFTRPAFYGAAGVALLLVLPNLLWQAAHAFPVVTHLRELHGTQLVNVQAQDFLLEQFLFHLPVAPVWMLGLVFLFSERGRPYRLLGWVFAVVVVLLLALSGKSYYTFGLYPMLFAAGACRLEVHARRGAQVALFAVGVLLAAALSPFALPFLSVRAMVAYGEGFVRVTGIDAPLRWEDGRAHALPQDYADMLGWEELAGLVEEAYRAAPAGARTLIYAENYGQAGAVTRYLEARGLPAPVSFSDSYRLWAPRDPPDITTLIYINDELGEDVAALFADVRMIGAVQTPYARERGTRIYLCQRPRGSLRDAW